jgi:PAS domain S-box-containing protein
MCYTSASTGFQVTRWNQAWFDTFGFDPQVAQGQSGESLKIWVDPERRRQMLQGSLRGEANNEMEACLRFASGEVRTFLLSTVNLIEKQVVAVLVSFFDLTDLRQTQRELLNLKLALEGNVLHRTIQLQNANVDLSHALEKLKLTKDHLVQSEKLAALGAMMAGIAHELNTPIGNGITVATTLEHRIDEFSAHMAQGIKRSELVQLLNDIKLGAILVNRSLHRAGALISSFKQDAADHTAQHRKRFMLSHLVAEILPSLQVEVSNSDCELEAHIDDELAMDTFFAPLTNVITHIVQNALTHAFSDKRKGTICIMAKRSPEDPVIVLTISDDGCGIAASDIHHVFEPFFTTRFGQGRSGLGLHIVHNIVSGLLGGTIDVLSERKNGTTFVIKIPTEAPDRLDHTAQRQP